MHLLSTGIRVNSCSLAIIRSCNGRYLSLFLGALGERASESTQLYNWFISISIHMKKTSGFTLIELLVVIAIIGILSGVVLTSLNSTRGKGRIAVVQQQFSALQKAALTCLDDGQTLAAASAGTTLCTGSSAAYPTLPASGSPAWAFGTSATYTATSSFVFSASGYGKSIVCDATGCVTR